MLNRYEKIPCKKVNVMENKKKSIYDGVKMSVKAVDALIALEILAFVAVTAAALLMQ